MGKLNVVNFFTEIYQTAQNENLFATANRFAEQYQLSSDVISQLKRLEIAIVQNELYQHVDPERHYSLLHADFKLDNMTVRKSDESLVVLDWGSFAMGPRFMDMALLLGNIPISLNEIKKDYLQNEEVDLEPIEEIYFLLGYIFMRFIQLNVKNMETLVNKMMIPAVEEIEVLVERFKKTGNF